MKISRPALIVLMLVQFALFWQFAKREIVWAYPADFDQSSYLSMDYTLYQDVLRSGLFPALAQYMRQPHPTGVMLPLQGCAVEFLAGPGRLPNLLLNFGYFVLLEIVFFVTARWLGGRTVFGWIGVGMLMMLQSPFLSAGGLFDCRIDLIACCLYGIFVCLLVRSDGLREGRWLAAAAGCGLLLMSFRFVTFAYLLGFCTTLFTLLLGARLLWRGSARGAADLGRSLRQTLVFGLGILAVGGAVIASNWKSIHDYYVVGHLTGSEKHIRALEMGITGLTGHFTYYLSSSLREHLGTSFVVAWLVLLVAAVLTTWIGSRRRAGNAAPGGPATYDGSWVVPLCIIAAGLFAPWFILTLDESKSPVVANVLDAPAALLLVLLLACLGRSRALVREDSAAAPARAHHAWWGVAAAFVLVLGSVNWATHLTRQGRFSVRRASVEQIGALYDFVGKESTCLGFHSPVISADMVADWVVPSTINVALFERNGLWLDARPALGVSIFALTREEVFAKLEQSDITLLSTFSKEGPYPFYDSIRPLEAEIRAWCDAHLLRLRVFRIDSGEVAVYARPGVELEGLSGEWITPVSVHTHLAEEVLDWMRVSGKHSLVLEGTENPAWLPKAPTATARPVQADRQALDTGYQTQFTRPSPGVYQIRIDLAPLLAAPLPAAGADLEIRLGGSFFVPAEIGINADTRQLVETRPTTIRFE